jgi:hypothetical protein
MAALLDQVRLAKVEGIAMSLGLLRNQATPEQLPVPELKLPLDIWEVYRLADIRERLSTNCYMTYSKHWGARPSVVGEDIKFLYDLVVKLTGKKK